MKDLAKTLTKRDCDKIIESFEEMRRCAKLSIDALKQMDTAVEEASKIVSDWRDSYEISDAERRRFKECIVDYCALNGIGCNLSSSCKDLEMTFDNMKTGKHYEFYDAITNRYNRHKIVVCWDEVSDLSDTTRSIIDFINRELLKIK